ncbi:MAG: 16S rRNA (uracil(1498)-N(3))-methyltransferase [Sandaracinaceae bacterium]
MRTVRLPCASLPAAGGEVRLDAAAAHHLRVLRLGVGASLVLFDGAGGEAEATLVALASEGARCEAGPRTHVEAERPRLTLCPGLPKGTKLDAVVRAATELGVAAVCPFVAERSVSRPDDKRAAKRTARLTAVAREAARQSGRADVPLIAPPRPLATQLAESREARWVAFHPRGTSHLAEAVSGTREASLVVGPEGGLSDAELALIEAHGGVLVSLGPTVLRTETAGAVVVALAAYALGAMQP